MADKGSMIKFESNGTTYTLEFDRASVVKAERLYDISMSELATGKTGMMQMLFYAAFIKHHPNMKRNVMEGFWDSMPDKTGLYEALVTMYAEVANATLEDPEEGKALAWKVV